jgi:hypothetical protein
VAKKKKQYVGTSNWIYVLEHQLSPRRTLTPGDKFRIRGERGWFKFICVTTNPDIGKTWVDCRDKNGRWRSFYLDRIKKGAPKRRNKVVMHDER